MTIWFFGDSWPAGCELELFLDTKDTSITAVPELAFPAMVGKLLNKTVINMAKTGASQEFMIESVLQSNINPNDIIIFCCTAKTRRMYRRPNGTIWERQFNHDSDYVNPYEDERVSSHCLSLLYYMSQARKANTYFFNLFDCVHYMDPMYQEIPENCWLIPIQESVLSYLYDSDFFHQWDHHHNGDFRQWLDTECLAVQKYIRPCQAHPNLDGHKLIAEYLVEQLRKRGHT
jgi:hypothetical protein